MAGWPGGRNDKLLLQKHWRWWGLRQRCSQGNGQAHRALHHHPQCAADSPWTQTSVGDRETLMWNLCHAMVWEFGKLTLWFIYLCVRAHDLARFLVECLTVPLWIQPLQCTGQAVVLTHKQCVHGRQSDVLVHAHITLGTEKQQSVFINTRRNHSQSINLYTCETTNLQWNRAPPWLSCRWWLFYEWHTCSPGEGGRAAAHGRCLWTLNSQASGLHHYWGHGERGQAFPQSHTLDSDPGRTSGNWAALSWRTLRRNCMQKILCRM